MFEKVLVCLDGSPLAEEILSYIVAEGRHFSQIVLLQVLHAPGLNLPIGVPGESGGPLQTGGMLAHLQKELEEAPVYLEEKARPLREQGIDVECVVLQGVPSEAIIEYARENGVTLIAMATHGHTGLRQIAMGSTAEYVLKHAGLPLLIVTPGKKH